MALCNFRTLGNPSTCPATASGPNGFCVAHERIYEAMQVFGMRAQNDGRERALQWAREHRYSGPALEKLNKTFDPNCIEMRKAG